MVAIKNLSKSPLRMMPGNDTSQVNYNLTGGSIHPGGSNSSVNTRMLQSHTPAPDGLH